MAKTVQEELFPRLASLSDPLKRCFLPFGKRRLAAAVKKTSTTETRKIYLASMDELSMAISAYPRIDPADPAMLLSPSTREWCPAGEISSRDALSAGSYREFPNPATMKVTATRI